MVTLVIALGVGMIAFPGSSGADVSAVTGNAYGYFLTVSLFGAGPFSRPPEGPAPQVMLASDASNSPQTASIPSALAQVGPAIFFTSGPETVTSEATTGPTGSVTSTTDIQNTNTSGQESFTAEHVTSTCTASEGSGARGSTTITNGTLLTDSGLDINDDDDYTDEGEHPPVEVAAPVNPAPNTTYEGHVHVASTTTDNFRYVFNEQVVNSDGSITVYAGHQQLLGPVAVGDLFFGKAECGVSTTVAPPTGPTCMGQPATIVGTNGDDVINGTDGPDVIVARRGDDYINGRGGDDLICAGGGDDRVVGGEGNDRLFGNAGDDRLLGQQGDDLLNGGADTDTCKGGGGQDTKVSCENDGGPMGSGSLAALEAAT